MEAPLRAYVTLLHEKITSFCLQTATGTYRPAAVRTFTANSNSKDAHQTAIIKVLWHDATLFVLIF
jgi:hypothetical protein